MLGNQSAAYLLTNCTSRKSRAAADGLSLSDLPQQAVRELARDWAGRLDRTADRLPAGQLYKGRGMREALAAAQQSSARLKIVSAGVGFVGAETLIPAYEATITRGHPQNPLRRMKEPTANSTDWWFELTKALGQPSPVAELIRNTETDSLAILAISRPYLEMLVAELSSLNPENLTRIRIISHGRPSWLPKSLLGQSVSYPLGLDGPSSPNPGTKSDFVQRAARHFVTDILPNCPKGSASDHQIMVNHVLGELPPPQRYARARLTDDAIVEIIARDLALVEGQSSRMLRHLRDNLNISCEQRRFRDLFKTAVARN